MTKENVCIILHSEEKQKIARQKAVLTFLSAL